MRHSQAGAAMRGLTLIEVLIVIALLAIAVAIVYPNVVRREAPPTLSEGQIIEQAKALAVARAESVRLSIRQDGTWEIVSDAAPESGAIAFGQLAEAPTAAVELRVTELGACFTIPIDGRVEGRVIDAVSCTLRP